MTPAHARRQDTRERAASYVARHPGTTSAEVAVALSLGRSSALAALQWLRDNGTIEVRGLRRAAGWWTTGATVPQPKVNRRSGRITRSAAAAIRRAWLLRHPIALPDGDVAVLSAMGPDLTAGEWAQRLGCAPVDVERVCAWLDIGVQPEAAREAA
jgi:hypothetical protein